MRFLSTHTYGVKLIIKGNMRPVTVAAIAMEDKVNPQRSVSGYSLKDKGKIIIIIIICLIGLLSAKLIQFKRHSTIFTWYWILWSSEKLMFNCIINCTDVFNNQGRPQDFEGGGPRIFFQICKFACSPEKFFYNGAIWCFLWCILIRFVFIFFQN